MHMLFAGKRSLQQENANLSADVVSKIPGLRVIVPQGAMYMMVRLSLFEK